VFFIYTVVASWINADCAADALTVEACFGIEPNTVRIRVNPMDIYKYVYTYVYI